MLSIGKLTSAKKYYHFGKSRDGYHARGSHSPGFWDGTGIKAFGVAGSVTKDEFDRIVGLIESNAQSRESVVLGFDLAFSAPKELAILAEIGPEAVRDIIYEINRDATSAGLAPVQTLAGYTRRGKRGQRREKVDLLIARFPHLDSRSGDLLLHEHAVVFNIASRTDGTTGTLDGRQIYLAKMAAGAVYRCELARLCQERLGLQVKKNGSLFSVPGVPESLVKEFSTRSQEIEAAVQGRGFNSAAAKSIATLATRPTKEHRPIEELRTEWRETARQHGFTPDHVVALIGQSPTPLKAREEILHKAIESGLAKLETTRNHFRERDLLRAVAEELVGTGIGGHEVMKEVVATIEQSPKLVTLGMDREERVITTRINLEIEQRLLGRIQELAKEPASHVREATMDSICSRHPSLSGEQSSALDSLCRQGGQLRAIEGVAGTGKSALMKALKEAFEADGHRVFGCSVSGKATKGLEASSGIRSYTVRKLLDDLELTAVDHVKHVAHQFARAAQNKSTWSRESVDLRKNDILVVDEPGMLGCRSMAKLLDAAKEREFVVVMVGDSRQLQPVLDLGGAFKAVTEQARGPTLNEIKRQRDEWARVAVKEVMEGDAVKALARFEEKGLLYVGQHHNDSLRQLVADWMKESRSSPEKSLVLASTNEQVRQINSAIQEARRMDLSLFYLTVGDERIHVNDRVVCTMNSKALGVTNGSFGTVKEIDVLRKVVTIELDDGGTATIPLKRYDHIQIGYCSTVHRAQGATTERAYAWLGGALQDREMAYVQVSRAREQTRLYTNRWEAGDDLSLLAKQMSQSRRQELAHQVQSRLEFAASH